MNKDQSSQLKSLKYYFFNIQNRLWYSYSLVLKQLFQCYGKTVPTGIEQLCQRRFVTCVTRGGDGLRVSFQSAERVLAIYHPARSGHPSFDRWRGVGLYGKVENRQKFSENVVNSG